MGGKVKKVLFVFVFIYEIVYSVRVSPKLDFGSENSSPDAKVRTNFQSKSLRDNHRENTNFSGINIKCVSDGNCTAIDKQNGIATDILVHVQTKLDDNATGSSKEAVPDIPVIVGTKTNEFPSFDQPNVNYNLQPPYPVENLLRNGLPNGLPNYHYYQSGTNRADSYPIYNGQNPNGNSQFSWNTTPRHFKSSDIYNPIEFKKVYSNSWSDLPTRGVGNEFKYGRYTPYGECICNTPNFQEQFQPTY